MIGLGHRKVQDNPPSPHLRVLNLNHTYKVPFAKGGSIFTGSGGLDVDSWARGGFILPPTPDLTPHFFPQGLQSGAEKKKKEM